MQVQSAVDNLIRKSSVLEAILVPFGIGGVALGFISYLVAALG